MNQFLLIKMKYDYVFWDIDGTMRPGSSKNVVFSEVRDLICSTDSRRHGIISNGHHDRQLSYLSETEMNEFVNMDLFFTASMFAEEALLDKEHELRESAVSYSFEDLRTEASKHKDYMYRRVREKIGDSSAIVVDDSLMAILSAKRNGFKAIFIIRNESDYQLIDELQVDVDYVVKVGELSRLKEILL